MKSRQRLDDQLRALENTLPDLLIAHPDRKDFWIAFEFAALPIITSAGFFDGDHARHKLGLMLQNLGIERVELR